MYKTVDAEVEVEIEFNDVEDFIDDATNKELEKLYVLIKQKLGVTVESTSLYDETVEEQLNILRQLPLSKIESIVKQNSKI